MNYSIFGLGYVGTVTAACLTRQGHQVVGVDINDRKLKLFAAGHAPVVEPEVAKLLSAAHSRGAVRATQDVHEAIESVDAAIICVGTPSLPNGELDLGYVRKVAAQIGEVLATGTTRCKDIIFRSTMLPGSTASIKREFFASLPSDRQPQIWFFPEFLREGTAVADYLDPALVVMGGDDNEFTESVQQLCVSQPELTDYGTAELLKYICNAFHATKVTFANEVGRIGKHLNIDSRKVMDLLCQDTRLNISKNYLRPGNPFGGSCLPKDVSALSMLARREGLRTPLLENLIPSNAAHLNTLLSLIRARGERDVAILGLTFKADTDDLRHSPMVEVAQNLLGHGYQLRIYDPNLSLPQLTGRNETLIMAQMPHLATLLRSDLQEALGQGGVVLAAHRCAALEDLALHLQSAHHVIDINHWPGLRDIARSYEGYCW